MTFSPLCAKPYSNCIQWLSERSKLRYRLMQVEVLGIRPTFISVKTNEDSLATSQLLFRTRKAPV